MLQSSRSALRIVLLTVGFILFVTVTIHSASQVSNRQLVAGKPHLLPTTTFTATQLLAGPSESTAVTTATVTIAPASDSTPTSTSVSNSSHANAKPPKTPNTSQLHVSAASTAAAVDSASSKIAH